MVTGLSGSGKSVAIKAFEDLGFYCVDNLPIRLLPTFAELALQSPEISQAALGIDIREGDFFSELLVVLDKLKREGFHMEILFLEAQDEVLVRRYSETRRRHPLAGNIPVLEGIKRERELLEELRQRADRVIDTSECTVHQLREIINTTYQPMHRYRRMAISIISFGYKFGLPINADLVFDIRFLPNPHFVPELRPYTGNEERVARYVLDSDITRQFLQQLSTFLRFLLPLYEEQEQKAYLTIAIGCTGGKHRSVAIANYLERLLTSLDYYVTVRHRDLTKEG
ncbi:MAG: RNase adapter RapZ [Nitrospinota bacterium]|nr:MAG: RNase adapter RapZ [Nitrospinota bacterium]